jgi:hypothetical protein
MLSEQRNNVPLSINMRFNIRGLHLQNFVSLIFFGDCFPLRLDNVYIK